jgi:membrane-bound lytic murein transglycosylase D
MSYFMSSRTSCASTHKAFVFAILSFFVILSGCAYIGHSAADDLNGQKILAAQTQPMSVWASMREGFALAPLTPNLVERQVKLYSASGTHLTDSLTLAKPYLYYVLEEVKKRNMPTEIAMLPFLESSFNIRRGKGLNPAGLWGLMPVAARHLNLTHTPFVDERRDIIRSTEAALDLLQELHAKFGDWHLALAAYNWGPGNMAKAIQGNQRRKLPTDYLSLKMPVETMVFVPKLLALRNIIENPTAHHVTLPEIPNTPYFAQVEVPHAIDIGLVVKLAELSKEEFVDLNPSFNKSFIPGGNNQKILLPVSKLAQYEENYRHNEQPLSQWRSVFVDQPQTLETLAKTWQVDSNRTRHMNNIRMGTTLKAGAMVVIPKPSLKND